MKILLSAGHGGTDSGSIGADKGKEKDRTIELANKVAEYLKKAGHDVTCKTEKTTTGAWRFKNRKNYDYALSIHFNAFNNEATGTECLYKNTKKKATDLSKKVADVLGITNRGAKNRTDLYMLNIGFDNLIEVCFHDNQIDLDKYNKNKEEVAKTIAEVINDGKIENTSSSSSSSTSSSKTDSIDVDGKWGTETTKKAQKVFGTTVDGIVSDQYKMYKSQNPGLFAFEWKQKPAGHGSELIKAIQKKVGAKVNGFIGPETISKMQKWLGTTQDGYVSNPSNMVKAFQKWLNKQ